MNGITKAQERVADRARLAAAGLDQIGGASRLTKTELDAVNRTLQNGLDAYRALGQEAPKDLQRVADAVAKQRAALDGATKQTSLFGAAQDLLTGSIVRLAGPAALGLVVKQALDYADTLTKMSDRTGIGVVALQRLEAIANASGNTIEDITGGINKFQQGIASGKIDSTIREIGLSVSQLRSLSPDEQFIAIAKAIQQIQDPATQTRIAVELFGKSGAQLLPTLKAPVEELADATVKMSKESVAALDRFGDGLTNLKTSATNTLGEIVGLALRALNQINQIPKALDEALKNAEKHQPNTPQDRIPGISPDRIRQALESERDFGTGDQFGDLTGPTPIDFPPVPRPKPNLEATELKPKLAENLPDAQKLRLVIDDISGAMTHLTTAQRDAALAAFNHGLSVERTTKILQQYFPNIDASSSALDKLHDDWQKGQQASAKFSEAMTELNSATGGFGHLVASVSGDVAEAVKFYLKAGVSQEALATAYGLTKTQVKALADSLTVLDKVTALEAGSGKNLTDIVAQLGTAARTFDDRPAAAVLGKMFDIEHSVVGIGEGLDKLGTKYPPLTAAAEKTLKAHQEWTKSLDELTGAFAQIAQISGGSFGGVVKDIANIVGSLNLATKAADRFFAAETKAGKAAALVSGIAAVGQSTSQGNTATRVAGGAATGAAVGSVVPGIGTAAGAVIGGAVGLFRGVGGPSKSELDARGKQVDLVNQLAVAASKAQQSEIAAAVATGKWSHEGATLAIVGRDAITTVGGSAQQADAAVRGLLDTHHPQAFAAAMKQVQDALQKSSDIANGVNGILEVSKTHYNALPPLLHRSVDELLKMKGLTDDQRSALEGLVSGSSTDFKGLTDKAAQFGITVQQLGPVFQQAGVNDRAKDIFTTFNDLVNAGADFGGVLAGMKPHIDDLVSSAVQFGGTVPQQFQPWIQQLIDAGEFIDANHDDINDLTQVNFANTPLDDGIANLTKAIDDLNRTLGGVPGAIDKIGKTTVPSIHIPVKFDVPDFPAFGADGQRRAVSSPRSVFNISRRAAACCRSSAEAPTRCRRC
jgi:hypothetical protein